MKKHINKCAFEYEEKFIKKKIKLLKDENKYNKMLKGYELFLQATEHMDKKEYDKALEYFEKGLKIYEHATIRNNYYKLKVYLDKKSYK